MFLRFNTRKLVPTFRPVVDPKMRVSKTFNAFFQPRGYLLAEGGKLRYSSFHGMEANEVIEAMEALLPADSDLGKESDDAKP